MLGLVSGAPSGLVRRCIRTHGWRRGLYSCAPLRGWGRGGALLRWTGESPVATWVVVAVAASPHPTFRVRENDGAARAQSF